MPKCRQCDRCSDHLLLPVHLLGQDLDFIRVLLEMCSLKGSDPAFFGPSTHRKAPTQDGRVFEWSPTMKGGGTEQIDRVPGPAPLFWAVDFNFRRIFGVPVDHPFFVDIICFLDQCRLRRSKLVPQDGLGCLAVDHSCFVGKLLYYQQQHVSSQLQLNLALLF